MNYQELRDAIYIRKPKYSAKFKPLMERLSIKGDSTGKGDFSTFGAFYQTYMYAYIIGLRLGEKKPLAAEEKIEFAPISNWKPTPIRDFIIMTLLNRCEKYDNYRWDWLSLENASEEHVNNFVTMLIREMEAYANRGLIYLQDKWDNEKIIFSSPFVFVNILQDLPNNNLIKISEQNDEVISSYEDNYSTYESNKSHEVVDMYSNDEEQSSMAAEDYECYQWNNITNIFGYDKTILLGCYKNNKYLSWIQQHRLYSIRLGARKGSMSGEDAIFEETAHLVLYDVNNPYKQIIYDIESCAEITGEQLCEMDYPKEKPGKRYMTFKLVESSHDIQKLTGHSLIEQIISNHPEHIKGAPVFIHP